MNLSDGTPLLNAINCVEPVAVEMHLTVPEAIQLVPTLTFHPTKSPAEHLPSSQEKESAFPEQPHLGRSSNA